MLVVTMSPMTFSGQQLRRGDVWEIPDNHPRLAMLLYGRHIRYCDRVGAKPGDNVFYESGIRAVVEAEIRFTNNELGKAEAGPSIDQLLTELKKT